MTPWDKMPDVGTRDHCLNCNQPIEVVMGLERPHWFHTGSGQRCAPVTSAEPLGQTTDPKTTCFCGSDHITGWCLRG